MKRSPFILLGVPVDTSNFVQTLDRLEALIIAGRTSGKSHQVATVNTDFVVNAVRDANLMDLLQQVDAAPADGMPVVWAARLLGVPVQERVAGADLVPALAGRAAQRGFSVFFYGAAPGVAQRAAQLLQQRWPGLRIAGCISPDFTPVDQTDPADIRAIRAARPDILLVALGNPKQEQWISRYRSELGVPLLMGVGGSLDFIAGERKRAPAWMHGLGLEWLFRLLQEPKRLWQRYWVDMRVFSLAFARQWWIMRPIRSASHRKAQIQWSPTGSVAVVRISGVLDSSQLPTLQDNFGAALAYSPQIMVDLSAAGRLNSAAIGLLFEVAKAARHQGGQVTLMKTPMRILSILSFLHLDQLFHFTDSLPENTGALTTAPGYSTAAYYSTVYQSKG